MTSPTTAPTTSTGPIPIDGTFTDALDYARRWHVDQGRKGSDVPYLSHLLEVAGLVLQFGGTQDQAIAGLLHDVVEDQGGMPRLEEIRAQFGEDIAAMVNALSDSISDDRADKAPWVDRKIEHIDHYAEVNMAGESSLLVAACDKLSNARSVVTAAAAGHDVFSRFKGGRYGTAWYYRNMAASLLPGLEPDASAALERACRDVVEAADQDWDELLGDPDRSRLSERAGGTMANP